MLLSHLLKSVKPLAVASVLCLPADYLYGTEIFPLFPVQLSSPPHAEGLSNKVDNCWTAGQHVCRELSEAYREHRKAQLEQYRAQAAEIKAVLREKGLS